MIAFEILQPLKLIREAPQYQMELCTTKTATATATRTTEAIEYYHKDEFRMVQ
jgi:hypothetical protein